MTITAEVLHKQALRAHWSAQAPLADALCKKAISVDPTFAPAYALRAHLACDARKPDEAIVLFKQAIRLQPDVAAFHADLGSTLAAVGRLDEAHAPIGKAIKLAPNRPEGHIAQGRLYRNCGQPRRAAKAFCKAVALSPNDAVCHLINGIFLAEIRNLEGAEAALRRAVELRPDMASAHEKLGEVLLTTGRYAEGWKDLDYRYLTEPFCRTIRMPKAWNGEALEGKTLLIVHEGGFGDTINWIRYGCELVKQGVRVIAAVPPPLERLMQTLPDVHVVTDPTGLLFDYHTPIPRLPSLLAWPTIPASVPYLRGDVAPWQSFLSGLSGLKVGLCWAGLERPDPYKRAFNNRRSMRLEAMKELLSVPCISFVSLQVGEPASQLTSDMPVYNWTQRLTDFADTAGLISGLDVVLTVDTSVAHLASAIGKPVIMLDRHDHDHRWLAGHSDTDWYPSMRIMRQAKPGDWAPVIAEAKAALHDLVRGRQAA